MSGGTTAGAATAFNADMNNRQLSLPERQKAKDLAAKSGGKYTQQQIEDEMRRGSNTARDETAASNMIINPIADKALGSNSTDPMASTNFDKGAVFNNFGGAIVQVNRDGTPLGSKQVDPELAAYIQANTGGANSPYKWVVPQVDTANPNAGLNSITPNANGCVTAECAAGALPAPSERRSVEEIDLALKNKTCRMAVSLGTPIPGATVMQPIYDAGGKIAGWAAEKATGAGIKATAGALICD